MYEGFYVLILNANMVSPKFYQICCLRVFVQMGIFEIIPAEGSMHVKDIAAAVGADEALISVTFLPNLDTWNLCYIVSGMADY